MDRIAGLTQSALGYAAALSLELIVLSTLLGLLILIGLRVGKNWLYKVLTSTIIVYGLLNLFPYTANLPKSDIFFYDTFGLETIVIYTIFFILSYLVFSRIIDYDTPTTGLYAAIEITLLSFVIVFIAVGTLYGQVATTTEPLTFIDTLLLSKEVLFWILIGSLGMIYLGTTN